MTPRMLLAAVFLAALSVSAAQADGPGTHLPPSPAHEQAVKLYKGGQHVKAFALGEEVLADYRRKLGPGHPLVGSILNDLAMIRLAQKRAGEAEGFFRESLAVYERADGKAHPHVAMVLNNLGWLYESQGKAQAAETLYRRALAIHAKYPDEAGPEAAALANLAALLFNRREYAEAASLFLREIEVLERQPKHDPQAIALALENLAIVYAEVGNAPEAVRARARLAALRKGASPAR